MDASSKDRTEQAPTTSPQGYLIHARNRSYIMPYHLKGLEAALALLARDIIPRVLRLKQERQKKKIRAMLVYEPDWTDWARYAFNGIRLFRDDLVNAGVDVRAIQTALVRCPERATRQDVETLEDAYQAVFLLRGEGAKAPKPRAPGIPMAAERIAFPLSRRAQRVRDYLVKQETKPTYDEAILTLQMGRNTYAKALKELRKAGLL